MYEVLPQERKIVPLVDLPSRGDTAFASAIDLGGGRFAIANYSSPLEGPGWPWAVGQNLETRVYSLPLDLPWRGRLGEDRRPARTRRLPLGGMRPLPAGF